MKKFVLFITLISIICVSVCGCSENSSATQSLKNTETQISNGIYPLYDSLSADEKEMYVKLCAAVNDFSEQVVLAQYESEAECNADIRRLEKLYRQIWFEQSEIFWIDPYNFTASCVGFDGTYNLNVQPEYLMDESTAETKKARFDSKLDEIVSAARRKVSTFDQVLYVYEYILKNASYDHELVESGNYKQTGINAYGCLIENKTICSGYTLAFDAILKRMGFECGAEFNSYESFSIITGHVWNYCKLDGEYYYFDLTWDDTAFDSEYYKSRIDFAHMYFGINKNELSKTNFSLSSDAPTPECNGTKYNYFVHNGLNISEYSFDTVKDILVNHATSTYVALRFDTYGELLKAENELMTNSKIYDIFPNHEEIAYSISNSSLHLYIFLV